MATPAQLAANRANALLSTGPRSVEGKSASRFNALKHGADAQLPVIPGENPAEYETLAAEYLQRFRPETPDEQYHVQTMIDSDWQKRRLSRLETECYHILDAESPGLGLAAALLTATPAAKLLARTQRQLAAHQRIWYRALTELLRQRARDAESDEIPTTKSAGTNPIPPAPKPPEPHKTPQPAAPQPPKSTKSWPPCDEKTGKPLFFVG